MLLSLVIFSFVPLNNYSKHVINEENPIFFPSMMQPNNFYYLFMCSSLCRFKQCQEMQFLCPYGFRVMWIKEAIKLSVQGFDPNHVLLKLARENGGTCMMTFDGLLTKQLIIQIVYSIIVLTYWLLLGGMSPV
jgi:hypothetical protein